MKKIFVLFILGTFMTILLAGCAGKAPESAVTAPEGSAAETLADAVPFGQWADVEKHASGAYHPCKVRVTEVVKDPAQVQTYIATYNAENSGSRTVEPLTGKDSDLTEYIVIKYEVLFPEDFPTVAYGNQGISNPSLDFDAKTNDESRFVASDGTHYVDMGMNIELIKPSDTELPLPGSTFQGAILLQMIKEFDNFHLDYMYKIGESDEYVNTRFALK